MTFEGNSIFKHNYMVYNVKPYPDMTKLISTMKLYLSYDKWIHNNYFRVEVEKTQKIIRDLIEMINQNIPRFEKYKWKIPKIIILKQCFIIYLKFSIKIILPKVK